MIVDRLFDLQDLKYRDFSANLTPNLSVDNIIGVRVPQIRLLAKEINNTNEAKEFLNTLPHRYWDENMLHGCLISLVKDYDTCLELLEAFLPYIDNWAVCDTLKPKPFNKNKDKLIINIKEWLKSDKTYTIRFGIEMLMNLYLDDDFKEEYLKMVSSVVSDEYYVNMMIAWYFATALAKQWDFTIKYLENKKLSKWCHNKTIQKAIESYRITDSQKEYLRTLKQK